MGKNPAAGSSFCVLLGFILLAMGLAKIVMGIYYFHDCELERMIPKSLIVGGVTSVLIGVLTFLAVGFHKESDSISFCCTIFSIILAIFGIIWLIVGFSYVFPRGEKIRVPKCNPGDKNCVTCNSALLDFTIGNVIVEAICLAAIVARIIYVNRCK